MKETWKDIMGYKGKYQISNLGRVKSLSRIVRTYSKGGVKIEPERILKDKISKLGYSQVELRNGKKGKQFRVHRLVAQHFIPNPSNKPEVNHMDFNRTNNSENNLEWTTRSENIQHSVSHGRYDLVHAKARTKAALAKRIKSKIWHNMMAGQMVGDIKLLGNPTFENGKVKIDVLCTRCGSLLHIGYNGGKRCRSCVAKLRRRKFLYNS